jgi:CRP-like cAMP-binding protein
MTMDAHSSASSSPVELVPGASTLPTELVAAIERSASVRDAQPGTVLVRQHELVRDLVVLVVGRITTLVEFSGAGDLVVETSEQPGRIFGWSGLRPPQRATATVRVDGPSRVMTLPIDELISDRPRWAAAVCELVAAGLADRTREMATRWSARDEDDRDA